MASGSEERVQGQLPAHKSRLGLLFGDGMRTKYLYRERPTFESSAPLGSGNDVSRRDDGTEDPTAWACIERAKMFETRTDTPQLLVTVPVHNEQDLIASTVDSLWGSLPTLGLPYRLSLSEDGSTDGTPEVIRTLQTEFPDLLASTDPERRGRGYALRQLWKTVRADIYAFTDADLPAGTDAVAQVIEAIRNGADVATASRYKPGATLNRPPLRSSVSRMYNWVVRNTFRDGIYDHQCGVKAFSRGALETLLSESNEDSWFWDTEILVLAKRAGLRVVEIPVTWRERKYGRTPLRRLASDLVLHSAGYVRLVGRVAKLEFAGPDSMAGTPHLGPSVQRETGAQAP